MQCKRPQFDSWVRKICWRRDRLPSPVFLGFPCVSAGKESACNVGDLGSVPGLGRSAGEGKDTHFSILAWRIHGLYSPWGCKESDTTEQLSVSLSASFHVALAHLYIFFGEMTPLVFCLVLFLFFYIEPHKPFVNFGD